MYVCMYVCMYGMYGMYVCMVCMYAYMVKAYTYMLTCGLFSHTHRNLIWPLLPGLLAYTAGNLAFSLYGQGKCEDAELMSPGARSVQAGARDGQEHKQRCAPQPRAHAPQ